LIDRLIPYLFFAIAIVVATTKAKGGIGFLIFSIMVLAFY